MATEKDFAQGNISVTENPLDVAIDGRGFLQILQPDGSLAYTRDGSFQINATGQLVTSSGAPVQPAITIPNNTQSISISPEGAVSVLLPGAAAPTQVGTLQLADFINPVGLQPIGGNLFRESAASGTPQVSILAGMDSVISFKGRWRHRTLMSSRNWSA